MVPALTATQPGPPRRRCGGFGIFYVPNGMSMPYWSPKAGGAARRGRPAADAAVAGQELRGSHPDVRRPRTTRRRTWSRAAGTHARAAGTFLTCVPFRLTRTAPTSTRRDHDGPDRGAGVVEGDADHVAGVGDRAQLHGWELVRRRRVLRLHQHDLLALRRRRRCRSRTTIRAPCSRCCSVRAAARTGRRGWPACGSDRSILDSRERGAERPGAASSGGSDRQQARRVPRLPLRDIGAAHPDGRAAERARAAGRGPAGRHAERLRGARRADDGPAGAGLPDRPDAGQHVHAGAGGERPRVSGDRGLGLASPAVAPPGQAGQPGAAAQDQRVPLPAVRAPGEDDGGDARGRRHHARLHALPLRDRDQRQQHALPRRSADRGGGPAAPPA